MNRWLIRRCCTFVALAALACGTMFVAPQSGAQEKGDDGVDPKIVLNPGSTTFALATQAGLGAQRQRLIAFDADNPGTLINDVPIQGLQTGETLKGIDFRPADGNLYGLGSSSRLYRIDFRTGVATQVGTGTFTPPLDSGVPTAQTNSVAFFGFDFNPVPDRIRVVSNVNDQNLRLVPTTGAVVDADTGTTGTQTDPNVAYAAGDPNAGDRPDIVGAAYTNNFAGASSTTNYAIDVRADGSARLVTQGSVNGTPTSPNTGQLFSVRTGTRTIGLRTTAEGTIFDQSGALIETNNLVGFDITSNGTAYVSFTPINPFDAPSSLYTLDLATAVATRVGTIGARGTAEGGFKIDGIAVAPTAQVTTPPGDTTLAFSAANVSVAEDALRVVLTVTRGGTTTGASSIGFTTEDGTATESMDYVTEAGRINFAAGQTNQTIEVLIQDDVFREGAETFTVRLFDPQGGTVTGAVTTVTITDNDTATATTNPINDSAEYFVRQQYRDFLNRDPDASGFAFWVGEYNRRVGACNSTTTAGTTQRTGCVASARATISLSFFLSVEYQQTGYLVYRAYDVAFARVGTPRPARGQSVQQTAITYDEYQFETQTISRGIVTTNAAGEASINQATLEANTVAFFRDLVQRPAFVARFPASAGAQAYVGALFDNAGITPTAAERQAAIDAFGSGGVEGRAAALRAVANNDQEYQREFNRAFVLQEYIGYLRRDPDIAGYNFWLNKLDAASTATAIDRTNVPRDAEAIGRIQRAEIIESFIRSCEYQRRFGPPTTSPNDQPVSTQCGS